MNEKQGLDKQYHNYSEWTKGRFTEAVTVRGLGSATLIYLAGVGGSEENGKPGDIRGPGDIAVQTGYAFEKIGKILAHHGATLKDIVKMTSYLTSPEHIPGYLATRNQHFKAAGATLPAETLVVITRLAWPDMIVEVDVDAIVSSSRTPGKP
jgi:2-iminobutanoate/2-iminopropanoate deaminase